MTSDSVGAPPDIVQHLERLPGASLRALVARVSAGGWFEFYDLFMAGYISLGLTASGLFTTLGVGLGSLAAFVASGFAGMFIGTLLFGSLGDHFGRKSAFTWSLVLYSALTASLVAAPTALAIDALRFLAGISIGVQIVTIDAYISEIAPKDSRGELIALSQAICYTAVPVVAFVAYLLVPHRIAGLDGWRWVALFGALGAVFAWPIQAGMPESPRWLASQGRSLLAQRAVELIQARTRGNALKELADPAESPADLPELEDDSPGRAGTVIFSRDYLPRTLMLSAFNIFQTFGFYGFAVWIPVLLKASGYSVTQSLHSTWLIAIVTPVGPLLAMRFADATERKWQIIALSMASAACALALTILKTPWAIITFGALVTLANTGFSCAFHTYQSELYPTAVRAGAVGFVYGWSRLSSVFVGYLYAFVLSALGVGGAFRTMALAMVISATIVGLFGPRTSRRQLEALAR